MENGLSVLLSPDTPVGRVRLARFTRKTLTPRVRLLLHALPIFFTDFEEKTDVLQSTNKHTGLHSGFSGY